jgi:ParB family chromosome partitioning protein
MKGKRNALGRGLGSLIPHRQDAPSSPPEQAPESAPNPGLRRLPIESLTPSRDQPRKHFDEERLRQLSESLRNQGMIQPIVVTPAGPGRYLIVAGERRWRASQMAGIHEVPVIVRNTEDHERLELALVENIQRTDLNPLEEARAYQQLMDLRGYTHEQLSERLGRDRSTITNVIRLLKLPDQVQEAVRSGRLSMGHARALLGLRRETDMIELGRQVVRSGLSVRATEQAVRRLLRADTEETPSSESDQRQVIVEELEGRLRRRLGVRARIRTKSARKGGGVLEIPYADLDELDRVLHILLEVRTD